MSVKNQLSHLLRKSIEVAFPIGFTKPKALPKMIHIDQTLGLPHKKYDYFSQSGELIFKKLVKKSEKGFYGLPSALEVSQDIIVQLPENDMVQMMEIEQYFFEDEAP